MGLWGTLKGIATAPLKGVGLMPGDSQGYSQQALEQFQKIQAPALRRVTLARPGQAPQSGQFRSYATPGKLGATRLSNISTDPSVRAAQMSALSRLGDLSQGQLQPQDIENLRQAQQMGATAEAAQRGALLQSAQQRGVGGSGLELASQLAAEQGGANRVAGMGSEAIEAAGARGLGATQSLGTLASGIQGQDYEQAARRAEAQDIINRFNLENRQGVGQQNVDLYNQLTGYNQMNLPQSQFENEMRLAAARAGALQNVGAASEVSANRMNQFLGNLIQAGGRAMGGGG